MVGHHKITSPPHGLLIYFDNVMPWLEIIDPPHQL
jgi:hypothetical protein